MRILTTTALCAVFCAPAWAATITANFEGLVDEAEGSFTSALGENLELTMVGDSDVAASSTSANTLPTGLVGAFASSAVYALSNLIVNVPTTGPMLSTTTAQLFVIDDFVDAATSTVVDIIAAVGDLSDGGSIQYASIFDQSTFSGTDFATAVELGLANAPTLSQFAGANRPSTSSASGGDSLLANVGLTGLTQMPDVVDDSTDGGTAMDDDTGPDDEMVDGGLFDDGPDGDETTGDETPTLTAVPLPASALLMLAGLSGLAAFGRRKS